MSHPPDQDAALQSIADGSLAVLDGALSRIWLLGPGDLCASCAMRAECADQTTCLHLVRSAGLSTSIDGPFRRFPLGARQVGHVPVTLEPFVVPRDPQGLGLADPVWLMAHDVLSFAALPILSGGRCVGVVATFGRVAIEPSHLRALEALVALGGRVLEAAAGNTAGSAIPRAAEASKPGEGISTEVARSEESTPDPDRTPPTGRSAARGRPAAAETPLEAGAASIPFLRRWSDIERDILERVLEHTGGRVSGPAGAARILGLKPTTLHSRLRKLGVRRKRT